MHTNNSNTQDLSIMQKIRTIMILTQDNIESAKNGIIYTAAGALFTYAYRLFTQQESYEKDYINGYNKGYSEGFSQGYSKGCNQITLIAGAACVGAIFGAAATNYFQHRQQNTQIINAKINQAISNNSALAEK